MTIKPALHGSTFTRRKLALLLAILFTGIGLAAAWTAPAHANPDLERVTLQLRWFHQFQFAGYYAALERGYYRDAGLDVIIQERDRRQDTVDVVASGQAEYGVTNSEVLLHALDGKPLVVLAAIFQHSPLVMVAHDRTGIYTPHDLIGARVKMTRDSRDIELQAMLAKEGVSLDQLRLTDGEVGLDDYLDPNIDALSAYVSNQPFYLQQEGKKFQILWPRQYGVDFYGDCLFTSQQELASRPDRVRAFREASLKGWEYAMEHPEEIVDLILERYNPQKSREHLLYEAETMHGLILPELVRIGHINPGRWRHIAGIFARLGHVPPEVATRDFIDGFIKGFIYDPAPPAYDSSGLWRWIWLLAGGLAVAGVVVSVLLFFLRQQNFLIKVRQQAEERILLVNHQLEKANAEKDTLFTIVAHDLKSPMSGLLTSTELLAHQPEIFSQKDFRLLSTELHKNVRNTCELLEDLLQWARMSQGGIDFAPKANSLDELVNMGLSTVTDMAKSKEITIRRGIPPELTVLVDQPMIKTVIRNILFNAIKFTSRRGEIVITARQAEQKVTVAVQDNGVGMNEQVLSSVFTLEKGKRQLGTEGEKGTGLGLMLCKQFIEQHGGKIWVESEPGKGTTVFFTLPVSE